MTLRTFLAFILLCKFVQAAFGADTLVVSQTSDLRALRALPSPKCLVVEAEADELSLRRVRKLVEGWGGVEHLIFDGNGFESLPQEALKMRCKRLTFQGQLFDDANDLVEQALSATYAKTVALELSEFSGLAIRERSKTKIDSMVLFSEEWTELHASSPNQCTISYLSIMVPGENDKLQPLPVHYLHTIQPEDEATATATKAEPCKKYVSVAPPIETMKVPFETFTMTGDAAGTFTAVSGSVIRIPENAFLNERGQPFTGEVQIDYREFRNPLDFLRSGIRMGDVSADTGWYFKSSGMFEINARSGEQELMLAQDKEIQIDFASANDAQNVNFWRYEDGADTWLQEGTADLAVKTNAKAATLTPAYYLFQQIKWRTRNSGRDTTQLQNRFANFNYIYNYHLRDPRSRTTFKSANSGYKNQVRLTRIGRSKEFGTYFFLTTKTRRSHPELRYYKDVAFAVGNSYTPRELRKAFKYRTCPINDVRISGSDQNVNIRLKGNTTMFDLEAQLIERVEENNRKKWNEAKVTIVRYNRAMKQRTKAFNRKERKTLVYYIQENEDNPKRMLRAWNECRRIMTPEERALTQEQWFKYCDSLSTWEAANTSGMSFQQASLLRRVTVNSMGIWNCDIRERLKNEQPVLAEYRSEDKKQLFPTTVYVMSKRENTTLKHSNQSTPAGFTTQRLLVPNANDAQVVAVFEDDSIGVYTFDQLQKDGRIGRSHTFILKLYDAEALSPKALDELLGNN